MGYWFHPVNPKQHESNLLFKSIQRVLFYSGTKDKINYVLQIVEDEKVISTKFVKKLIGSEFYELRIRSDNVYRVIIFAIDNDNINNSTEILLLNRFIKKSNDYTKELNQVRTIKENFIENEYNNYEEP